MFYFSFSQIAVIANRISENHPVEIGKLKDRFFPKFVEKCCEISNEKTMKSIILDKKGEKYFTLYDWYNEHKESQIINKN